MLLIIKKTRNRSMVGVVLLALAAASLTLVFLPAVTIAAKAKAKLDQRTFAAPEEAVKGLLAAARAEDVRELLNILGPDAKEIISSGDEVADKNGRELFVRMYDENHNLAGQGDARVLLEVGKDQWPFPIPIVKEAGAWRFDTREGKQEMLTRRIGKNELSAIQACLAYFDAQREYAAMGGDGRGLPEYAQKFLSEPGKKDGLYWEAREGEAQSPLGALFAAAQERGYARKTPGQRPSPYLGYYYRILTAQGKNAPGGAHSYLVNGRMVGGFALIAYPAEYGVSGVMTFMVSHDGVVYEKDLGRKTGTVAPVVKAFDPDPSWRKVEPKYLEPYLEGKGA